MDKFDFLRTLKETAINPGESSRPKLTDGIKYEEYSVTLHNDKEKTVYIPTKRTEVFESGIESELILTEASLRQILRKCNGVTEI